jgi:hypothetical protein
MSSLKNELKNLTTGYKVITNLIKNKVIDLKFKDDATLLSLLEYHPTKTISKTNIEYLVVRLRKPYNTPSLFYKMNFIGSIEDDVSYRLCIQVLFEKYDRKKRNKEDIMSALRSECHYGTKTKYFLKNTVKTNYISSGKCCACHITTCNITVDHFGTTYQNILDMFLEKNKHVKLELLEIFENDVNNELRLKDTALANEWLNFHDTIATYRLLCNSCNSQCGGYGYISKNKLKNKIKLK